MNFFVLVLWTIIGSIFYFTWLEKFEPEELVIVKEVSWTTVLMHLVSGPVAWFLLLAKVLNFYVIKTNKEKDKKK